MKQWLVFLSVLAAVFFSQPTLAPSADWWEKAADDSVLDRQSIQQIDMAGSPLETAVRVNWVDDYIEVVAGGTVDNARAVNMAHALSMAQKTARHLAYEKLAETIHGISIMGDATYDRELMLDSNLRTEVQALMKGAQVIEESHDQLADGSILARVRLGIHITGPNSLMSSSQEWVRRHSKEVRPEAVFSPPDPPAGEHEGEPEKDGLENISGVIIDAGGLDLRPAMVPRIYNENGEALYGLQDIDESYLTRYGMVGYAKSVDQARANERVGDNPLVLRARKTRGENQSDVILSPEDASKLFRAGSNNSFLKECRVVFVIN